MREIIFKSLKLKKYKKVFDITYLEDLEKISNNLNDIIIIYENKRRKSAFIFNENEIFFRNSHTEKIRGEEKTAIYLYSKNDKIGKAVVKKNGYSIYLHSDFFIKNFDLDFKEQVNIKKEVNLSELKKSMIEKDIDIFIKQADKIADIVLYKKCFDKENFRDYKQDIMIKAFRFITTIDNYKIHYENEMDLFNYVYRIAYNTFINSSKKETAYKKKHVLVGEVAYGLY